MKEKDSMLEVKIRYVNLPKTTKYTKSDFFVYKDIEVKGHAEHTGYVNNTRVCAGVSACTLGIMRLLDEQHHVEHERGYFHVWLSRAVTQEFKKTCDMESVYALNTLVCQLYEIYLNYPNAFKKFDLIEEKENNDEQEKSKQPTKRFRKRKYNKLGLYSISQKVNLEED